MAEKVSAIEQIASQLMKKAFARQAAGEPGRSPEEMAYLIGQARHRGRNTGPENSAAGFRTILSSPELSRQDKDVLNPLIDERVTLGCLLEQMPPSLQRLNAHWRKGFFFRDEAVRAAIQPTGQGSYRVCDAPSPGFVN